MDPVAAYNSAKNAFADVKKVVRVVQILFFLLILAFFALVFLSHLK